jgi:hypothetical protein
LHNDNAGRSYGLIQYRLPVWTGARRKMGMTTNYNTQTAAGSTSTAKTIGGSDTTQPGAGGEESELVPQSTHEQDIRNRAYEIYLQRGTEPGDEAQDWFQAEREFTK